MKEIVPNSSTNFTPNAWNYWAIIRSGTTVNMYVANTIPGTPTLTGTVTDASSFSGISKINFGGNGATIQFMGSLGPTRVTNGIARAPVVPSLPFPTC